MQQIERIPALRSWREEQRQRGKCVALVPTMGNLHDGHLALLDTAREHADTVIASIFVNPLQFGAGEDFSRYPRTRDADMHALREVGCDAVFAPPESEIYPDGRAISQVSVPRLGDQLCGIDRPGHFDGVTTVVNLLFNLVQPEVAVFGQKDFQQLQIIRRMVRDLHLPVAVLSHPILRAADGLALSSRNQYLDQEQRARAPALHAALQSAASELVAGARDWAGIEARAVAQIEAAGMMPIYLSVRDPSLDPTVIRPQLPGEALIVAAARLGTTRLIDNIVVRA